MPNKDPELRRAYNETYHATHKAERKARERKHRLNKTAVAEHQRAYAIAYYANNSEEMREYNRNYYATHKEAYQGYASKRADKTRETKRLYRQSKPDEEKARASRRRARKNHAPINDFTTQQWKDMKAHYGHRCVYCGKKQQRLTLDHITPLIKGGSHTLHNIVPACKSCNSKKQAGAPLVPVQPLLL